MCCKVVVPIRAFTATSITASVLMLSRASARYTHPNSPIPTMRINFKQSLLIVKWLVVFRLIVKSLVVFRLIVKSLVVVLYDRNGLMVIIEVGLPRMRFLKKSIAS